MAVIATAIAVASVVYSYIQYEEAKERQKQAQREAEARADAAKGFQISVEGEAASLPVLYGRALIGGVRVFHNVKNAYTYAAPASGGIVFKSSTNLDGSLGGDRNQFLFVQTALTFAGLNNVIWVDIDDRPHDHKDFAYGQRIHVYLNGDVVDPLISANCPTTYTIEQYDEVTGLWSSVSQTTEGRSEAKFSNTAYATSVYRLNRDDPQYNGVPEAKFYTEGNKVRTIVGSAGSRTLSTSKLYSNNPVLCLLDYLTDPIYGRGLEELHIDLDTFFDAYMVAEKIVKANVPKEGVYWTKKGGTRNIHLYECNLVLDSKDPIRDNIGHILDTMPEAAFYWTSGKYKLNLIYPTAYSGAITYNEYDTVYYEKQVGDPGYVGPGDVDIYRPIQETLNNNPTNVTYWKRISIDINDSMILLKGDRQVQWPNATYRYNYCTVRFLNEALDFVEDTVSWPPKYGTVEGTQIDKGAWNASAPYDRGDIVTYSSVQYQLSNGKARVNATTPNNDIAWYIYDPNRVYNIYKVEDNYIPLETESFEKGITSWYHALAKAEATVRKSRSSIKYSLVCSLEAAHVEPGDILKVNSDTLNIPGELLKVVEVSSQNTGEISITADKYNPADLAWNVADDEVVTPRNIFSRGITNVDVGSVSFSEINDAMSLRTGTLTWSKPSDARVNTFLIRYTTSSVASIQAVNNNETIVWVELGRTSDARFDVPDLLGGNYTLTVVSSSATGLLAPRAGWPLVAAAVSTVEIPSETFVGVPAYKRSAGSVPATPTGGVFNFTSMSLTTIPSGWSASPPAGDGDCYVSWAVASNPGGQTEDTSLDWNTPYLYLNADIQVMLDPPNVPVLMDNNGTNFGYASAYGYMRIFSNNTSFSTSNEASYSVVSNTNCSVSINNTNGSPDKGKFTVSSLTGSVGTAVLRVAFRGNNYDRTVTVQSTITGYIRDTTPPPTPTLITVESHLSWFVIKYNNGTGMPGYTEGHGHQETVLYGKQYTGGAAPVFADAVELTSWRTNSGAYQVEPNTTWYLWVKWKSIDNVLSSQAATSPASITSAASVTQLLSALETELSESHLTTSLNNRINLIDAPTTGLVTKVSDLETTYGSTASAATSAANAASSAAAALISETNAGLSEDAAATSASQASTSATNASTSAGNASTSASNASTYAGQASTSASNAASSASSASTSASTATTAKNDAQTAATSAQTYAGQASTSATNAAGSASTATTQAGLATTAKNNAETAATNASISASNAATSASNANGSSVSAATSASNANTYANNALGYSSSAGTSANNAAVSAGEAASAASSAATSASTATTAKNDAQTAATDASTYAGQASTSASNAASSASSASTSAGTAATSANNAATSASNASTYAGQASTSATNAAGSASSASTYATNASASASAASGSASAASTSASNASASASAASGSAASAASSLSEVQAIAGNYNTTVNQAITAVADRAGNLEGRYTVRVNANGYVAGFGLALYSNSQTVNGVITPNGTYSSEFAISADTFWVGQPGTVSKPFIVRTSSTVVNGVTLPAGVYITDAYIGTLDAGRITAGSITTSSYIQSANYVAGSTGWKISGNGSLEMNTGTFRGALSAATGTFSGSLSSATGTFSGSLSAATGSFSGSLTAATGTFSGTLTASSLSLAGIANLGTITAGHLQNPGNTNYIELGATGSNTFLKVGSNIDIKADGSAIFNGPVISRNLEIASGVFSGFNGVHQNYNGTYYGEGNYLQYEVPYFDPETGFWGTTYSTLSLIVDTGIAAVAWNANDKTYAVTAGLYDGAGYDLMLWGSGWSFYANVDAIVEDVFTRWRWTGQATICFRIRLWVRVDGATSQFQIINGVQWRLYRIT